MKQAMKTEKPVVEAAAYEPPCMTVVPIRTSGMLCGSVQRMQQYELDASFGDNFQESYDDAFSNETMGTATNWGDDFFTR